MYRPSAGRSAEQVLAMERLGAAGRCGFCPPLEQPVLHADVWWSVTPNLYPYEGVTTHLLLVPRLHVADLADLPDDVLVRFWPMVRWVRAHALADGPWTLVARCGPCELTGGSVEHVHAHVLQGSGAVKLSQRLAG